MFVRSNIDDSFIVIVTFLCISLIAEKVRSSSDFEPTQQGGHVYPMAVVLYDETLLTPFQKDSRQFTFDGIDVSIKQNWKEVGVAAVVWDAAVSLAGFLVKHPDVVNKKRIIELGAGTGLAGIVAAKLGGDVTFTDRRQCLSVLEENVKNNLLDVPNVCVEELEWGEKLTGNVVEPFDVVLGADIIYIEESFPALLKTLQDLTGCQTKILVAQKIRYERDSNFLSLLEDTFTVHQLDYRPDTDVHIYSVLKKC